MIFLSELASIDIKESCAYLQAESPRAAQQLLNAIDFAFSVLQEFPNIGHERSDLTDYKVRFYKVHKYLIIYRTVDSSKIEVVRFLHGYQDLVSIL